MFAGDEVSLGERTFRVFPQVISRNVSARHAGDIQAHELEVNTLLLLESFHQSNFELEHFAHIAAHELLHPLGQATNFLYLIEDCIIKYVN
jgi:hypothetical protein